MAQTQRLKRQFLSDRDSPCWGHVPNRPKVRCCIDGASIRGVLVENRAIYYVSAKCVLKWDWHNKQQSNAQFSLDRDGSFCNHAKRTKNVLCLIVVMFIRGVFVEKRINCCSFGQCFTKFKEAQKIQWIRQFLLDCGGSLFNHALNIAKVLCLIVGS